MKIDRTVQRVILEKLAEAYPEAVGNAVLIQTADADVDHNALEGAFAANLAYLRAHGLVEPKRGGHLGEQPSTHITARGVDFLLDDGGLTAILGVVTVKLHDDTIKRLIEARVLASDLPPAEKQSLIDKLRSFPAKGMEHLALKLVEKGVDASPQAVDLIKSVIDSWPG